MLSALRSAAGQHLAAVGGRHSLAEAVLLGALALLGLIGTEHCMTPPFYRISGGSLRARSYSTAAKILPPQ